MSNSEKSLLGTQPTDAETKAGYGAKRLDSWKDIAAFFNRNVRTVQRWEHQEDMPVHRHVHHYGGSVFAYCDELTKWRANRCQNTQINRGKLIADRTLVGSLKSTDQAMLRTLLKAILDQMEDVMSNTINDENQHDERPEQNDKVVLNPTHSGENCDGD